MSAPINKDLEALVRKTPWFNIREEPITGEWLAGTVGNLTPAEREVFRRHLSARGCKGQDNASPEDLLFALVEMLKELSPGVFELVYVDAVARPSPPTKDESRVINRLMQWFGVTDEKYVTRDFLQKKIQEFTREERAEYARQLFARMTATVTQSGWKDVHASWEQMGQMMLADLGDMLQAMLMTLRVTKPEFFR